jgi:hypothetical protein
MGNSKKRNAPTKDQVEITLFEVMQQTPPKDPAKQIVRSAVIFLLTRKDENCSPGTNPAMLLAVGVLEREGLTHESRHDALVAVQNFANENGGVLFDAFDDPEDDESSMARLAVENLLPQEYEKVAA